MFKKLWLGLCLLALALSACQAMPNSAAPDYYYDENSRGSGGDDAIVTDGDFANEEQPMGAPQDGQVLERLVIKNAQLSLVVADTTASLASIANLAEGLGGFVVSSNTYQASLDAAGNKLVYGNITIRVPAEKLNEVLTQLKGQAVEVRSENVSGQDVTAEYTDLESRLTNLTAAEAQLQKIMEDANKTEDVLTVYNQLVAIRGEIESVKGQMKYYREAAALSAVSIELVPDAANQPIVVAGWQPQGVAKDAIESLVRTLQGVANALIWFGLYCLPLVLLFGLPALLVGGWAWRRWRPAAPKAVAAKQS